MDFLQELNRIEEQQTGNAPKGSQEWFEQQQPATEEQPATASQPAATSQPATTGTEGGADDDYWGQIAELGKSMGFKLNPGFIDAQKAAAGERYFIDLFDQNVTAPKPLDPEKAKKAQGWASLGTSLGLLGEAIALGGGVRIRNRDTNMLTNINKAIDDYNDEYNRLRQQYEQARLAAAGQDLKHALAEKSYLRDLYLKLAQGKMAMDAQAAQDAEAKRRFDETMKFRREQAGEEKRHNQAIERNYNYNYGGGNKYYGTLLGNNYLTRADYETAVWNALNTINRQLPENEKISTTRKVKKKNGSFVEEVDDDKTIAQLAAEIEAAYERLNKERPWAPATPDPRTQPWWWLGNPLPAPEYSPAAMKQQAPPAQPATAIQQAPPVKGRVHDDVEEKYDSGDIY